LLLVIDNHLSLYCYDKIPLNLFLIILDSLEELIEQALQFIVRGQAFIWKVSNSVKVSFNTDKSWVLRGGLAKIEFLDSTKILIEP
jgi:hypothetical protein